MINLLSYIFGIGVVVGIFLITYVALPRMLFVKTWTSELDSKELLIVKYAAILFGSGCVFFFIKLILGY